MLLVSWAELLTTWNNLSDLVTQIWGPCDSSAANQAAWNGWASPPRVLPHFLLPPTWWTPQLVEEVWCSRANDTIKTTGGKYPEFPAAVETVGVALKSWESATRLELDEQQPSLVSACWLSGSVRVSVLEQALERPYCISLSTFSWWLCWGLAAPAPTRKKARFWAPGFSTFVCFSSRFFSTWYHRNVQSQRGSFCFMEPQFWKPSVSERICIKTPENF